MITFPIIVIGIDRPLYPELDQDPQGVRAGRHLPARPRPAQAQGPGHHPRLLPDRPHGQDQPAAHHHGHPAPGRHHQGQRHGQGQRRPLLQGHRPAQVRHRGPGLYLRHLPAGPDDPAEPPRPGAARRPPLGAGEAQRPPPGDHRTAHRPLGHQGPARRDETGRPAGEHAPGHRQAGRGRARTAGQGHPRRGRVPGRRQAHPGRRHHLQESPGPPAPLPEHADRDRHREELDHRLPAAPRAPPRLLVRKPQADKEKK